MAFWMLVTGSINTISTKYADYQCVPELRNSSWAMPVDSCSNSTAHPVQEGQCPTGCAEFDHPFVQALGMFLGEAMCMLAFKVMMGVAWVWSDEEGEDSENSGETVEAKGEKLEDSFPIYIFAAPAACDCLATSLMYLGLTMTYPSVFQMLRGSVVVFTGVLSVVFLGRKLEMFHWMGMVLVTGGVFTVGVSAMRAADPGAGGEASNPALGNILIVAASIIVSCQMVLEEKFLSRYKIHPLQVVGWEGVFGLCYLSVALAVMYNFPFGQDTCDGHPCVENTLDALRQMSLSTPLAFAVVGNVMSIAFFNYFGVSVTQSMSATHRMVLDSLRTIVIWAFSIFAQWQTFDWLQVVGFAILLTGTLVYNQIIEIACLKSASHEELRDPLMGPGQTELDLSGSTDQEEGTDGARGAV